MHRTIGTIIRSLRKERNLTQEELAELLNISGQAVSKWENDTSLPDIAQIVPLAKIFGVSTDVLFDTFGQNDEEAVRELLRRADASLYDADGIPAEGGLYSAYTIACEGLKRYPNNMWLLMYALEKGIALAYPENDGCDPVRARGIYGDCIRMANIVLTHGRDTNDLLRVHAIMTMLHAAYGNFDEARAHSDRFPERADMTVHQAKAFVAHIRGDAAEESLCWRTDAFYHAEALVENFTRNGCAYRAQGRYAEALTAFFAVFELLNVLYGENPPPLHVRESGDVHVLIAQTYLDMGDADAAVAWLARMAEYEENRRETFGEAGMPLVRDPAGFAYLKLRTKEGRREVLRRNLTDPAFERLKKREDYRDLLKRFAL